MPTTTFLPSSATMHADGRHEAAAPNELVDRYRRLVNDQRMSWTDHHRMLRLLGAGGQGLVYLSQRRGTDNFTIPVALKIFSPQHYEDVRGYEESMSRIARVAARVAQIQQDNLLDVHNFVERNRIRIMEMEWVDGYDLAHLLNNSMLDRLRARLTQDRWDYVNNVIVTAGPKQPRLKPGIAIAVLRDCLAGLAALHRVGIVHGDIKPSNIMLKRTGDSKIIDIGSAFDVTDVPARQSCTPSYAAPEVLEGHGMSPRSDLCSLGYVLVEMLAGVTPFAGRTTYRELLEAKRLLPHRLHELLPWDVVCNELLMNLLRSLVAADPTCRFPSAEAADMRHEGAAAFHRQLVKGDLASEYHNDIRLWLAELG